MGARSPFEVHLSLDVDAPGKARALLKNRFASVLGADELQTATLLTSELVTNAVKHGRGRITFRAQADDDRLLIEVIDEGSGFERAIRRRDFDEVGGWGLHLVEAESSRWGVHEGTTHVWFELERPGPRLGVPAKPTPPG